MYSVLHDMLIEKVKIFTYIRESKFEIPSRYYTTLLFGLTVKFGPSIRSYG